jgi:hypothetical protein
MNDHCHILHKWLHALKRFSFPFDEKQLPFNGIYFLFEKGESAHNGDRITRIGSHTGANQLRSRLHQHFLKENKDRSIFRKNIGRALLNKNSDAFLEKWELDLTSAQAKFNWSPGIDFTKQQTVEKQVSKHIKDNFSFVVMQMDEKIQRLNLERRLIATVSHCSVCKPTPHWFGKYSTKEKIRNSGLWQEQHLWKEPLSEREIKELSELLTTHN